MQGWLSYWKCAVAAVDLFWTDWLIVSMLPGGAVLRGVPKGAQWCSWRHCQHHQPQTAFGELGGFAGGRTTSAKHYVSLLIGANYLYTPPFFSFLLVCVRLQWPAQLFVPLWFRWLACPGKRGHRQQHSPDNQVKRKKKPKKQVWFSLFSLFQLCFLFGQIL